MFFWIKFILQPFSFFLMAGTRLSLKEALEI